MKKIAICFLIIIGFFALGATVTNVSLSWNMGTPLYVTPVCQKVAFNKDVNNVTVTLGKINGWVDEIVVDSTGADTSFKVYLKDENNIAFFSKENFTSDSEPYRLPVTITNGTNYYYGARVNGSIKVQIKDCNDVTMTDLDVYVYFRDFRK